MRQTACRNVWTLVKVESILAWQVEDSILERFDHSKPFSMLGEAPVHLITNARFQLTRYAIAICIGAVHSIMA